MSFKLTMLLTPHQAPYPKMQKHSQIICFPFSVNKLRLSSPYGYSSSKKRTLDTGQFTFPTNQTYSVNVCRVIPSIRIDRRIQKSASPLSTALRCKGSRLICWSVHEDPFIQHVWSTPVRHLGARQVCFPSVSQTYAHRYGHGFAYAMCRFPPRHNAGEPFFAGSYYTYTRTTI